MKETSENKLLKQGRVTLKKMCLSAWRLKEYVCVLLRMGHFEMSVFVFLLSVVPLTSPVSAVSYTLLKMYLLVVEKAGTIN